MMAFPAFNWSDRSRRLSLNALTGWRDAGERLSALGTELARRNALAMEPRPTGVRGPALPRLLAEFQTPLEIWRAERRTATARKFVDAGPSRAVMLLPGFGTNVSRMKPLARALDRAGHRVSDWGLGFNFGPGEDRLERLSSRIEVMARREGEPIVLVGWSLGGLFAREVARRCPESVRLVVTMGTPFSGDRRANNAWRAYQLIAGHPVDAPPSGIGDLAAKPPVPTVALWSARDGVVSPRSARGRKDERDLAIALRCTHLGFASHPQVAVTLVHLLAEFDGAH